jgi:antirestriction protein ArdC
MTTQSSATRRDIAGEITSRILAELDKGVLPWRKPWDDARTGVVLPRRATGEAYRGVNILILWSAATARGFGSPYWLTFNQATKSGAHVRKGERGEIVVYYGRATRTQTDTTGAETEDSFRFLKSYVVFNAEQIEGLPADYHPILTPSPVLPIAAHEAWFAKLEIARIITRNTACYIPSKDVIGMSPLSAFDTAEDYAATLDHEAVHATKAAHRVGRDMGKRFSTHAYAAEELVAEIGASILGAHLNLPPHHIADHASYISPWMKLMANDKRAFLTAAAEAQRAVDWLLAKSPAPQSECESLDVAA